MSQVCTTKFIVYRSPSEEVVPIKLGWSTHRRTAVLQATVTHEVKV